MPKDRSGKKISWKEFMKRWGEGIEGVTPLQQTNVTINSTIIIMIGLLAGFVISIINIKTLWWLSIILVGGFGNTWITMLGLLQKRNLLIKQENLYKEVLEEENENEQERVFRHGNIN